MGGRIDDVYHRRGRAAVTLALAGVAVGILAMILLRTAHLTHPPLMPASPGERFVPLEPSGWIYRFDKRLLAITLVGTNVAAREDLTDRYYERLIAHDRPGAVVYERSDKCMTVEVARATSARPEQCELALEPRGLVMSGILMLPPLDGPVPAMWSIPVKAGPPRITGWPLLAQIGLSRDETIALRSNRMIGMDEEAAFNPVAGETIRFYQRQPQTVTLGDRSFECAGVDYQAFLASAHSTHRLDGQLWIAKGFGCVKEVRRVSEEITPRGARPELDFSYSVKTETVRTLAEKL